MDQASCNKVFGAQTQNVRALSGARVQLSRAINDALKQKNYATVGVLSKSLALVFCAWVEASFSKLIHTPHGFTLDEIATIKQAISSGSVVSGWERAIQIAMTDHDAAKSNFDANDSQKLSDLVDRFVKRPSLLRNKIAHGQWIVALNGKNTDINSDVTNDISEINSVMIDTWFECQEKLIEIVEHLIHSPNKAFIKTYRARVDQLEQLYQERQTWTDETKRAKLLARRRGALETTAVV
ncbi:hypothetical protein GR158_15960 [Shinella sp. AETb1-6]|uniref:hypothetical protein n=1 Tax=Shinella sp. AETb1-6 TaxID=2692210 RepID=UPI00136A490F|nr:hypothetical protein [Shinella sp. AETb1-6]MXN52617.1 hypothetical protein [Shinella sp. AETb1-6]